MPDTYLDDRQHRRLHAGPLAAPFLEFDLGRELEQLHGEPECDRQQDRRRHALWPASAPSQEHTRPRRAQATAMTMDGTVEGALMNIAFDELLDVARRVGVVVRHAPLGGGGGGLACLKGQKQLFVALNALPADQLEQTVRALAGLRELETLFIRPDLRALLDEAMARSDATSAPPPSTHHGD